MLGLLAYRLCGGDPPRRRALDPWHRIGGAGARRRSRKRRPGAGQSQHAARAAQRRRILQRHGRPRDGAAHALRASLAENRALMLEMHHRIKNSLQVIQSYLALIRRSGAAAGGGAAGAHRSPRRRARGRLSAGADAQGHAADRGKPFLDEICAAAVGGLAPAAPACRLRYRVERRTRRGPRHSAGSRPRRGFDRRVQRRGCELYRREARRRRGRRSNCAWSPTPPRPKPDFPKK